MILLLTSTEITKGFEISSYFVSGGRIIK